MKVGRSNTYRITLGYSLDGEPKTETVEVEADGYTTEAFEAACNTVRLRLIERVLNLRPHCESYERVSA